MVHALEHHFKEQPKSNSLQNVGRKSSIRKAKTGINDVDQALNQIISTIVYFPINSNHKHSPTF